MDPITIVLTAIALSMDAFAVSVTNGICIKNLKLAQAIKFGIFFGFFQFAMPIIGFFAGLAFTEYVSAFDHWIAFFLLVFIGGKIFIDTYKKDEHIEYNSNTLGFKNLIMLSIATSIDALAAGVSFAMLDINIFKVSILIGIITCVLSTIGAFLGKKIGHIFKNNAERVAGIILIFMGIHILIDAYF